MLRYAADENFDNRILRGVQKNLPEADIIRIQDTEIYQAGDHAVLAWVAAEKRILISHDVRTLIDFANQRVNNDQPMAGLLIVNNTIPIGQAIDEIVYLIQVTIEEDWINQVRFLPL